MAGQLIVLPGVTVAASAGVPRINMNAPDTIASKISTLKHVVSARTLTAVAGGGVSGRCRVTGALLTPKGAQAASLGLADVAGKIGLGISGAGGGGLALPVGSLTSSFTMVMAIARAAADIAGGGVINFLSGFSGDDTLYSMLARYYGATSSTTARQNNVAASTGVVGNAAQVVMPSGAWDVVVVDYDAASRLISIAVNQAALFNSVTMSAPLVPPAGSYVEIGYHVDSNGLRNSKVGDLYAFNDSLLRTDFGKGQLSALVAAMKTFYAIA